MGTYSFTIIGEVKRFIKSRVAPGANASNALVKIAARRHYERTYGDNNIGKKGEENTFHIGESVTDPELWGPPLRKYVDIAEYSDAWNLSLYLRKYWSREKGQNLSDTVISGNLIAVAPQLYYNTVTYDCLEYPTSRSKKLTAFVTLLILVDANAEETDKPVLSVYRRYFAETVLFLHTNTKLYIHFL